MQYLISLTLITKLLCDSTFYSDNFSIKLYSPEGKAFLIFVNGRFYTMGRIIRDTLFAWIKLQPGIFKFKIKIFYDECKETELFRVFAIKRAFNVKCGDPDKKCVALTFDCGGYAVPCREIFEILDKYNLRCTMFLTGQFIENFPEVTRYIASRHEPANHTYSHPHFTTYEINRRFDTAPGVNKKFVQKELLLCDSLFYVTTGRHFAPFWRAPYGEINPEIAGWAEEAGFIHVGWSYDIIDWADKSTPELYEKSLVRFKNLYKTDLKGKIILMHIGAERTAKELPKIIRFLLKEGFKIVTISELMGLPQTRNPWEIAYEDSSLKTLYR